MLQRKAAVDMLLEQLVCNDRDDIYEVTNFLTLFSLRQPLFAIFSDKTTFLSLRAQLFTYQQF
jgi:hypothetical protein